MNWNVIQHLALWYGAFLISGYIFWISLHPLFSKLSDKGYVISKVISLLIPALVLWVLGFILKVPVNNNTIVLTVGLLLSGLLFIKFLLRIPNPKVDITHIVTLEFVFLVFLVISLYITSFHSAIDAVTERPMDFKILNELTVNSLLPPKDVWYTSLNTNYYYFGYYFMSFMNKLTFTDPYMGYLFGMGFIYAFFGTITFSLAHSVKRNYFFATLAALFVMFFSNISFLFGERIDENTGNVITYGIISKFFLVGNLVNGVGSPLTESQKFASIVTIIDLLILISVLFSLIFIRRKDSRIFLILSIPIILFHFYITKCPEIMGMFINFMFDTTRQSLWYPDVSRVIGSTINEFPFYSIIIGDMHPHFLDLILLPIVLTLLFLDIKLMNPQRIIKFFRKSRENGKISLNSIFKHSIKSKWLKKILLVKLVTLLVLSATIVTNSWELIVIGIFLFIKDFIVLLRAINFSYNLNTLNLSKFFGIVVTTVFFDGIVYFGAFALQIPYIKSITSPVNGIRINLVNNSQDFLQFFRDNFSIFPFVKTKEALSFTSGFRIDVLVYLFIFILIAYAIIKHFWKDKSPIKLMPFTSLIIIILILTFTINKGDVSSIFFVSNTASGIGLNFDVILRILGFAALISIIYSLYVFKKINFTIFSFVTALVSGAMIVIAPYSFENFYIIPFFPSPTTTIQTAVGLDTVILLISYLGLLFYSSYLVVERKISSISYVLFAAIITPFFILLNAFSIVFINFIQKNFDLSPMNQFWYVWAAFYILSSVGLFFLIKKLWKKGLKISDYFIFNLFLTGIGLSIWTEFFYVADFFARSNYPHHRANTVFKVNYIGFVLLGIASAWTIYRILKARHWQRTHRPAAINYVLSAIISFIRSTVIVMTIAIFLYAPYTTIQWNNHLRSLKDPIGLDGYEATKEKYPEVMAAVEYFKSIKTDKDILLEVNGDAYAVPIQSYMSTYTNTPSVLGWWGHEAQWRETPDPRVNDEILRKRVRDIANMYKLAEASKETIACDLASLGDDFVYDKDVLNNVTGAGCLRKIVNNDYEDCLIQANNIDFKTNKVIGIKDCVKEVDVPGWKTLYKKYGVTYIVVGYVEKQKLKDVDFNKNFYNNDKCFEHKYGNEKVDIFKVNYDCLN